MIKANVDLRGLTPQMAIAYTVCCEIYRERCHVRCVITSASDGKHGPNSLHYKGKALDLRTSNVPRTAWTLLLRDLQDSLGPQFDVVLEADHFHVEFDPKEQDPKAET